MQIKVFATGENLLGSLAAVWRLSCDDSPVGSSELHIRREDEEGSLAGGRAFTWLMLREFCELNFSHCDSEEQFCRGFRSPENRMFSPVFTAFHDINNALLVH